ncbi:hypothetical protein GLOIN_2v1790335, partial [Rhizophagus irregularis DAOM 181602=DAOM 197198]
KNIDKFALDNDKLKVVVIDLKENVKDLITVKDILQCENQNLKENIVNATFENDKLKVIIDNLNDNIKSLTNVNNELGLKNLTLKGNFENGINDLKLYIADLTTVNNKLGLENCKVKDDFTAINDYLNVVIDNQKVYKAFIKDLTTVKDTLQLYFSAN